MRPDLARRQREKAEALAATDPRLDLSLASLDALADREETDDLLAYVGEVLLLATGTGEWDRLDGAPAIKIGGRTFDLRGMTIAEASKLIELALDPTDTTAARLWPAPRRRFTATPWVLVYVAVMVALMWSAFGPRAAFVGAAFGLGFTLVRRLNRRR